ncbi:basic phospholipase A2 2-like isoform X2 [Rhinatrema bivittatum]|nr:basic phospholipase A2 2-like isoform X2 [Rhinatrema bivittatum]
MVHGNLIDFAEMVKDVTGKDAAVHYASYGCYCGAAGRGKPVDATDKCCHAHDCCYADLSAGGCRPQFDGYDYTVSNGNVTCDNELDDCGMLACECDRTAALCFKTNLDTYDRKQRLKIARCRGRRVAC